jgi:cytochrome b6-f complex iron-sulfur subunit
LDRREFLKETIKLFFVVVISVIGIISLFFLYPAKIKKRKIKFFEVLKEENLPKKGIKTVVFEYQRGDQSLRMRVFIVNHNGRLFAVSPVCTHLGCLVSWHRKKQQFLCPCHGGKYDIEGKVIGGPPPRPLTRLPLKIKNSRAYIGLRV